MHCQDLVKALEDAQDVIHLGFCIDGDRGGSDQCWQECAKARTALEAHKDCKESGGPGCKECGGTGWVEREYYAKDLAFSTASPVGPYKGRFTCPCRFSEK